MFLRKSIVKVVYLFSVIPYVQTKTPENRKLKQINKIKKFILHPNK